MKLAKLTKPEVAVLGLVWGLERIIGVWNPPSFSSERLYRDSLLEYLQITLPDDCSIEREYRHHGTTTDLHVAWSGILQGGEAFIEVKRNLDKKATLDRLVGQLESLKPGETPIVVVLVGSTDRGLLGRLVKRYEGHLGFTYGEPMAIVNKGSAQERA